MSVGDSISLGYNGPALALPDLLVCRPQLTETILTAVSRSG